MPDFTITQARNEGEKDNPHGGKLVKWKILLQDAASGDEEVYCQKKPGNDLSPGMEISGRLEKGEYGWRLFPEQQQGNFTAPPLKHGVGPATGIRHVPDPQRRSIERQVAAKCAAELLKGQPLPAHTAGLIRELTDAFYDAIADVELGSGQAAHGASSNSPAEDAADLSAETGGTGPLLGSDAPAPEASPQQKGKLTQMFHAAGLSREAMKAVVLFRCGSEKATKQGASQLITDLQDGATHDALLAEIYDAHRAGNPLGTRAAALIPSDTPADVEGLPELDPEEAGRYQ